MTEDLRRNLPPRPRAVALGYDLAKDDAPRVLASGGGLIADKIIALARDNGIPIHEDPALAAALATVDLDAAIPPELYAVVAEVLAYVYRVSGRTRRS
ncbi:MAG: EscU/YscU/HrcU family type III secretion system export apparatus switch protein [Chloroflexi bacterium]|nr:EscU/YscU/HrcU family type III secretion system export apparatus switch protein [Chloroflexota bacterium]